MKHILIPTTFEVDTQHALKIAADICEGEKMDPVMLSVTEISDSITELLFLGTDGKIDIKKRDQLVSFWNRHVAQGDALKQLKVHHQYGFSRPILKQILLKYNIGLAIVPLSFQQSKNYIHQLTLRLLHQCETPVMLLPAKIHEDTYIKRALYLDDGDYVGAEVIHDYPFHVIRHSAMEQVQDNSITSIVDNMKIDLIVKKKRATLDKDKHFKLDELNLPVLNV